VHLIKVQNART